MDGFVRRRSRLARATSWALIGVLIVGTPLQAAVITVYSSADTVIRQDQTGDNFGAYNQVWVGRSGKSNPVRRALFEFDLSSIPAGATINSASLRLTAVGFHTSASFGLYRTLVDWGEGVKTGKGGGTAAAGEASWNNRLTGTAAWGTPGGLAGTDYIATSSAAQTVSGTGAFTWSSAGLLADVQYWYANPTKNFGWFVISSLEGTANGSVNRLATRENTTVANRPQLIIDYSVATPSVFGVLSGPTPATLRMMTGSASPTSAVVVNNSGGSAGDLTITSPTAVTVTPGSQAGVAAGANVNLSVKWSDVAATGARSGSFTVHNATNAADADNVVSLSGAVVANRAIAAPAVDFGRFAVGSTATASKPATLATSGDSNNFTNVTVRAAAVAANADGVSASAAGSDVLFNAAGVTMARTVSLNKSVAAAGLVSGNLAMTVQGEGLTGESAAATVPYSYRVVNKRTVNGPGSAVSFGNLLQGATASAPVTFTSTTGDDNSFTRVSVGNQSSGGLSLGGTSIVFNGSSGSNSRTVSYTASTSGTVNGVANFAVTPEGIGDTGYGTINVSYTAVVGAAAAKPTPPGVSGAAATFDPALAMTANVTTSYAGLSSNVASGTGALGTTGKVLAGAASAPGQLSMNWRTRADDEKPTGLSDVLDVVGTGSDRFVLELKYDPTLLPGGAGNEAALAAASAIHVGWLNGATWVNAGSGTNQGPWNAYAASHGITDMNATIPTASVGAWGIDVSTHTAWVVSDHNSQYMVVPEPGTLVLVGMGLVVAPWFLRRRLGRKNLHP